jgi:proteasome lid subunit RPN8/RPN11
MTLIINADQIQAIYCHAEHAYPEECCGILLGTIDKLTKTLVEVIPTINAWEQSASIVGVASPLENRDRTKTSRYTIPPQAILAAQKRGRDLQLNIIGFFHSHPDCAAIPSICDRDRAWDIYSYPIVSVIQGKVSDLQSWVLDCDGLFQTEEIQHVA